MPLPGEKLWAGSVNADPAFFCGRKTGGPAGTRLVSAVVKECSIIAARTPETEFFVPRALRHLEIDWLQLAQRNLERNPGGHSERAASAFASPIVYYLT
ncbi:MAG: hypothetical protein ABI680_18340 [Chthoniobacteraceae bacterium]